MRKQSILLGIAAALVVGTVALAGSIKSGPQVGEDLAGPFHPLNVNGPNAGEKSCLYCMYGDSPVVMVFAREVNPTVTKLIKEIDAVTGNNKAAEMGSFVVFCNSEEGLEKQLKSMADKEGLKNTVLSIDNPAGPKGYKVAKDADITVVLYRERMVKANHSFKKGEMTEKDIQAVVADLPKILKK